MVEEMNINLKGLGPINEANVSFSNITVIAGHNATGKSSLSKFIYSFLKSNSYVRQEIAMESILKEIKELLRYLRGISRKMDFKGPYGRSKFFSPARFHKRRFRDVYDLIEEYDKFKNEILDLDIDDDFPIHERFAEIDHLIDIVYEDSTGLYIALMNYFLESEFSTKDFAFKCEITSVANQNPFSFTINYRDETQDERIFSNDGGIVLNNVYYIDSISILDTFGFSFTREDVDHIKSLKESLIISEKGGNVFDENIYSDIIGLENDINEIINGQFVYEKGEFRFVSSRNIISSMHSTASGIKQLGIIQLLLANRELKEDCVLIIDEPEVNLHPEWQMKLAEILVLISKRLNVSVYINTHSPLFVEAIHTFSYYYDMDEKTRFHLAQPSGEEGLFNIDEVEKDNLSRIYDNLGKPYLAMDVLRVQKSLE